MQVSAIPGWLPLILIPCTLQVTPVLLTRTLLVCGGGILLCWAAAGRHATMHAKSGCYWRASSGALLVPALSSARALHRYGLQLHCMS